MYYRPTHHSAFLFGHTLALISSVLLIVCACWLMLTFAQSLKAQPRPALSQRVDAYQGQQQVPQAVVVYTTEATDPRYYYSDYR